MVSGGCIFYFEKKYLKRLPKDEKGYYLPVIVHRVPNQGLVMFIEGENEPSWWPNNVKWRKRE